MSADVFDELHRMRRLGRRAALATIVQIRGSVPSFQSAKMLVRDDGSIVGSVGGGCVEAEVWNAAREVMREERSRVLSFDLTEDSMADGGLICGGRVEIFVEPVVPTPHVVLFGAGHISQQVARIARVAGFTISVVDNRPQYANAERFPDAEQVYADSFEEAFGALVPNEHTYLVIVTRGHQEDESVLRWAVTTAAGYIGMIGSKRKIRAIRQNLLSEGVPSEVLDRVFMPIGVEIGAVTPEEIAVSIAAELVHHRRLKVRHPLSKSSKRSVGATVEAHSESR